MKGRTALYLNNGMSLMFAHRKPLCYEVGIKNGLYSEHTYM